MDCGLYSFVLASFKKKAKKGILKSCRQVTNTGSENRWYDFIRGKRLLYSLYVRAKLSTHNMQTNSGAGAENRKETPVIIFFTVKKRT